MSRLHQFLNRRYGLKDLERVSLPPDSNSSVIEQDENKVDAIVEVKIKCLSRGDFYHTAVVDPFICVHICNEKNGQYLSKHINIDDDSSKIISNKRTFPQCFGYVGKAKEVKCDSGSVLEGNDDSISFIWDESIIINGGYNHILGTSSVLFFEVLDTRRGNDTQKDNGVRNNSGEEKQPDSYYHIAWGFLRPFGKNGRCNVGKDRPGNLKKCRIQLYQYKNDSIFVRHQAKQMDLWSRNVPRIFLQYLRWSKEPVVPCLDIEVGPIVVNDFARREMVDDSRTCYYEEEKHKNNHENSSLLIAEDRTKKPFVRQPEDKCLVPNSLGRRLHKTCAVRLKFSHSGIWLALATKLHSILIYDVFEGSNTYTSAFHDDEVTSLDWSYNNLHLCSASRDGTIAVHEVGNSTPFGVANDNVTRECIPQVVITLNPSFPSALAFVPVTRDTEEANFSARKLKYPIPSFLVSANDQTLKIWNTNEGMLTGEIGENIEHHLFQITALCVDESNGLIFSGDDSGYIIVWKPVIRMTLGSISGCNYTILHRINSLQNDTYVPKKGIHNLHFQNSSVSNKKILLVMTTSNCNQRSIFCYYFDAHKIEQLFFETKMNKITFTNAVLSPDGNMILAGTEQGKIIFMESSGATMKTIKSELDELYLKHSIKAIDWNHEHHMIAFSCGEEETPTFLFCHQPQQHKKAHYKSNILF